MEKCSGDPYTLLHPVTEAFDIPILHVSRIGCFHDLLDSGLALLAGYSKDRTEEIQVLMHSHVVIGSKLIGHVPDQLLDLGSVLTAINPCYRGRT